MDRRPSSSAPARGTRAGTWGCRVALAALLLAWLPGCQQPLRTVQRALQPPSPHEAYTRALESAGLHDTALGRAWTDAARSVLAEPVAVDPPFEEVFYVDPSAPRALAYAVTVRRGQRLTVEVALTSDTPGRVFVDLFEPDQARPDGRAAASADEGSTRVEHPAPRDGILVVRVQPELLRGGELRVRTVAEAALVMPVEGATARSIQGLFGAPRDGGRRVHEGIDIFAPRGTPVLAAAGGLVTSVGENPLGGRVVWLLDSRGYTQYYAHLDTQLVQAGTRVRPGDVIGTVGNTGNARTTPPHLHFGIYSRREGAIDPRWFVQPVPQSPSAPAFAIEGLGSWVRLARDRTTLRAAPGAAHPARATLPAQTAAAVLGVAGPWVRLELPDGRAGFVQAAQVTRTQPWRRARTRAPAPLLALPSEAAPTRRTLDARAAIDVLGRFDDYLLVRVGQDEHGWLPATQVTG
jgi:peptidoglycan LD-endopeptidase LytH